MESSSDRLDHLVARARALFERKHGSSEGCFAAFSPTKVNLMGDFIEGSGGLALQMSLDRRVVVFGRGRVVPEKNLQKKRNSPPSDALRKPTAKGLPGEGRDMGRLSGASMHNYGGGNHRDSGGVGGSRHSTGDGGSRHGIGDGSRHSGSRESDGDYSLKPMTKWSMNPPKTTWEADDRGSSAASPLPPSIPFPSILPDDDCVSSGRAMDTIVQDLVFGHRGRPRSSTVAPKEVTGSWLKDRRLLGFLKHGRGRSNGSNGGANYGSNAGDGSGSCGDGSGIGGGNNDSDSSTPTTRYDSNSSAHSVRMSVPTSADEAGAAAASTVDSSIVTTDDPDGNVDSMGTTLKSSPLQEDGGFSADSGSTTTEEAFPGDSSREEGYGSGGDGSHNGGGIGVDGGVTMLPNSRRASVDSSATDVSFSVGEAGEKVLSSASKSVYTVADAALASATEAAGDAPPVPLTAGEAKDRDGDGEPSPLPPPLLFSSSVNAPGVTKTQVAHREVGNGPSDYLLLQGFGGGGEEARLPRSGDPDPALARALEEAAQAKAEIEAAEAADREATRLRTSRVFCEACPQDGMAEFMANRGMRGGGDSWKGLITAVAAEYAQELAEGTVVGIEAVVVSDLPGSTRAATYALESSDQLEQQQTPPVLDGGVGGHGWANTARCALLMASATFLEEVLGMGCFPRMKAMRCYSAALRCRRSIAGKGSSEETNSNGAPGSAPAPFSSEGFTQLEGLGEVGAGEEMGFEDLLSIAEYSPDAGAMLVDTKWKTSCPVPMFGPKGTNLVAVIAQPLETEAAQRLWGQAMLERLRGTDTCRKVLAVARERHPDACLLRDVPEETLEALFSAGSSRAQNKAAAAAAAAAKPRRDSTQVPNGSGGGGVARNLKPNFTSVPSPIDVGNGGDSRQGGRAGSGVGRGGHKRSSSTWSEKRRLTPDVLTHARYLAAEVQRVAEVVTALAFGDVDAVGRLMMQSRRSAGLSIPGARGRQEPPSQSSKLAGMVSLLPGVYGSSQSEGRGGSAMGTVVALVDPAGVEGVLRAITTRGPVTTGFPWVGFAAGPGTGSGIVRVP